MDEIYKNVTNNKIIAELPESIFDQGNDVNFAPEIIDDKNYVLDLINTFKSNKICNKNKNKFCRSNDILKMEVINETKIVFNNSLLYYLALYLKVESSKIISNIQTHINDEDFDCLKNISNAYKKSVQQIKSFLIEDNTDKYISYSVLVYISYLYNITISISNNKIYKIYNYKNNFINPVLLFERSSIDSYTYVDTYEYNVFLRISEEKNLILYKSSSELNKMKITEVKELCSLIGINTDNNKGTLIDSINSYFESYDKF